MDGVPELFIQSAPEGGAMQCSVSPWVMLF
jgi:hypothetical protein